LILLVDICRCNNLFIPCIKTHILFLLVLTDVGFILEFILKNTQLN